MATNGSVQPQIKTRNGSPLRRCQAGHLLGGSAKLKTATEKPNRITLVPQLSC